MNRDLVRNLPIAPGSKKGCYQRWFSEYTFQRYYVEIVYNGWIVGWYEIQCGEPL